MLNYESLAEWQKDHAFVPLDSGEGGVGTSQWLILPLTGTIGRAASAALFGLARDL
ncbi:MAG: hypothetical protein J6T80_03940 [Paludibacteraceae bacterium]|nr:hypothetical protein [Paludibacteraceae bacterium]